MDDLVIKGSANDSLEVFTERTNQVTKFQVNRSFGFALKEVLGLISLRLGHRKSLFAIFFMIKDRETQFIFKKPVEENFLR